MNNKHQQLGKIFLRETQRPQEKRLTPKQRAELHSGAPESWKHGPDEPPHASPRKFRIFSPIRKRGTIKIKRINSWTTYKKIGQIIAEMGPEAMKYRSLRRRGKTGAELEAYKTIPVKASRQAARKKAKQEYNPQLDIEINKEQDIMTAQGIMGRLSSPHLRGAMEIAKKRAREKSERRDARLKRRGISLSRQATHAGTGTGAQIEDDE